MDAIDKIIAYESGELDEAETIEFFQEIIDSGLAIAGELWTHCRRPDRSGVLPTCKCCGRSGP